MFPRPFAVCQLPAMIARFADAGSHARTPPRPRTAENIHENIMENIGVP
jgi:hypothetical protein